MINSKHRIGYINILFKHSKVKRTNKSKRVYHITIKKNIGCFLKRKT